MVNEKVYGRIKAEDVSRVISEARTTLTSPEAADVAH
jgi:hypothetical protein